MPNITLQSMQGAITSGKALKAVYWPLIIRCKEKMKTWAPHLAEMVSLVIDGSFLYPKCVERYIDQIPSEMQYEVEIEQNTPLPEDETEEKSIDISEVAAQVMSKKSYMKKWRSLSDEESDEELLQIAKEKQLLEEAAFPGLDESSVSGNSDMSSISGREEGGIAQNQNGPVVNAGDDDTFNGSTDKAVDTTGDQSSRTLSDAHHV